MKESMAEKVIFFISEMLFFFAVCAFFVLTAQRSFNLSFDQSFCVGAFVVLIVLYIKISSMKIIQLVEMVDSLTKERDE